MKVLLLTIFSLMPFQQVLASTPKSVTCTRTEYREEYIPGTKSNPGYVRNYEVDVEIPCGGVQSQNTDLINKVLNKMASAAIDDLLNGIPVKGSRLEESDPSD